MRLNSSLDLWLFSFHDILNDPFFSMAILVCLNCSERQSHQGKWWSYISLSDSFLSPYASRFTRWCRTRGAQLLYALSLTPTVCPKPDALATQCVRRMEASNSSFSMTYVMILFSLTIIVSLCYRGRKTSSLRAVKVKDQIKSTIKEYGHNLSNAVSLWLFFGCK